jgi:hypothetical protein
VSGNFFVDLLKAPASFTPMTNTTTQTNAGAATTAQPRSKCSYVVQFRPAYRSHFSWLSNAENAADAVAKCDYFRAIAKSRGDATEFRAKAVASR